MKRQQLLKILLILLLAITVSCNQQDSNKSNPSNNQNLQETEQDDESDQEDEKDEEETQKPLIQEHLDVQCQENSDCTYLHVCNEQFQCVRKNLFPMTLAELLGSIAILIVVGIGQAAGIGGGLVVVPVLMTFFGYETKKSIALVFVTIFSASLGNLTSFMKQKYKDGSPLIDYKIVVLSLPTIMIGSVYGVTLNKFLPQAVVSAMLIFFILQSLTKTYRSYKKEKQREIQENSQNKDQVNAPLIEMRNVNNASSQNNNNNNNDIDNSKQYPRPLLNKILGITFAFIIFSFIRGGSKFESLIGIPPCGILYQLCNIGAFYLAYQFVKALIAGLVIQNQIEEKFNSNIAQSEQQQQLTAEDMQGFAKSAFLAGLIGAIVGIGGGMILVPKWLELGVPAQKTTPCSISLLFLTALNSVLQFGLSGLFDMEEIIYFSIIALLSSFIVSQAIQSYVKRTNQGSILIQIIVIFMLIALVLFGTMTTKKAMEDMDSLFKFGEFC